MKLTGPQYQQLQRALLSAFPKRADIEQMLMFQLGEALDAIASGGNLADMTFGLIQWAVAQGRLGELIAGARISNPGNAELRAFAEHVGPPQAASHTGAAERAAPAAQPPMPVLDEAEREHLKQLLAIQYRNLRQFERQAALRGGIDLPVILINQLDEVRREIARLEARLAPS